ncbi:MAG: VCBS repeat-containing protein, partial [Erysipelotrichaceae bacterium]|nr:VCBS repeat-containing protein [Erysipelotrichaceae bacterium]
MRRFVIIIIVLLLFLPSNAWAEGKSIQPFSSAAGIGNNGSRVRITYEENDAYVYYGPDGINIIAGSDIHHLDTNFEVLKLSDIGDVDGDGYTDFLTYQKAPEYTAQLIALSGKDGTPFSGISLTHQGFNTQLGLVQNNSYIQQLVPFSDGTALVVYDYTVARINPSNGEIISSYNHTDNIWKAVIIDDISQDGINDIAYAGQDNVLGFLDGNTLELIRTVHPAQEYEVSPPWDNSRVGTAVMNIWDLLYDNGQLFVTSEDGYLFIYDPASEMMEESVIAVPLEVIPEDTFRQLLSNQMNYYRNRTEYRATGITNWQYSGYRIADANEQYLLINCYMGDLNSACEYTDGMYTPTVILFDRTTNEIVTRQTVENFTSRVMETCLGTYKEQTVVPVINHTEKGVVRISLYGLDGEVVAQKDLSVSMISDNQKLRLSADESGYVLESFGNGTAFIDNDLKLKGYAYKKVTGNLVSSQKGCNVVAYSTNGVMDTLVCYGEDMETVLWQFAVPTNFTNHGIENLTVDKDYNGDGKTDMFFVVNQYSDESPVRSVIYVLNGNNGSGFWGNSIVTSQYTENGKTYTYYLVASELSVLADFDGDGRRELNANGSVISSKEKKIIGSVSAGVDTKGNLMPVGDINRDGVVDYVAITSNEAIVYLSSLTNSYGYVSNEYKKTGTSIKLDSSLEPMNYTVLFGDVNRDGVKELGILGRNNEKHQVYKIVNGANLQTMLTFCPEGTHDTGEAYKVLDFDLNGDGFNEIYGRENWVYGIYDGKTGEKIVRTTLNARDEKYQEENNMNTYYPDYIVPFYPMDEKPNFVMINDISGDGKNDLAINRMTYNEETWEPSSYIELVESAEYNVVNQIVYSNDQEDIYNSGLITVDNSERFVFITTETNCTLIDLDGQKILATYAIGPASARQFGDERILIVGADSQLYYLDTKPSFDLISEIPESIDDYRLKLQWQPRQNYSVMTIIDNGSTVYVGA